MAGNVLEWCAEWYDGSAGQRVVRGGSWKYYPEALRVFFRRGILADYRGDYRGFRLVQHIEP